MGRRIRGLVCCFWCCIWLCAGPSGCWPAPGRWKWEGYFLPVALLVPVWGPLCVVLLHTSHRLTDGQLLDRTLEKLRINEEIYKNILVAGKTRRKIPSSRWKRPCW